VANVALPYEAVLKEVFATALMVDQSLGYKIYEARK
jgi:16S rRNA G1207 methylase RsmC